MKLNDISRIGWDLNYIRLASSNLWPVRVDDEAYILESLRRLRWNLEGNMLSQDTVRALDRWIERLEKYEDRKLLRKADGDELGIACGIWVDRIATELDSLPIMRLDKCMTLSFELLQGGAKGFFEEDIWEGLSELSRSDLNEAARCLLCGIPTASAMIALRATEDVLRKYYKRKTRRNPAKKGWKLIIDHLLTEKEPGKLKYSVNRSLMGHLDFVRTNRNMVEHPERTFSKREAEGLFYQVAGTITEIFQDMGMKKSGQSSRA